jgi:hypothetical protein
MITDSERGEPIEPLAQRFLEIEERSAQRLRQVLDPLERIHSRFERLHELSRRLSGCRANRSASRHVNRASPTTRRR